MLKSLAVLSASLGLAAFSIVSARAVGEQNTIDHGALLRSRQTANATPPVAVERSHAKPHLDASDEVAALEAIQWALTEVADGSTYVWYRRSGRVNGIVQPTVSFKDVSGKICRHIVLELSSAAYAKRAEGIACRLATGVWQLEG